MAEVCCIGGMTLDRTLKLDESAVMASSNPATMRTAPGGVARNVAENLARLSVATSLFSQVGDDEHGREAVAATARAGVDVSQVQAHPSLPTGSYTAIVQPDGQLLVGAADLGACEAMDADWLDTLWPSISAARIVFADANLAPGVLEQLIKRTRGTDVELAINLVSVAKARRLPPDLTAIDLLFCNLDEARAVTGGAGDAGEAAAALGELVVGAAIVTAGADGAWLAGAGQTRHVPAPASDVVDVSGAGDALVAGFLFGRLRGHDALDACRLGVAAAAVTTASHERTTCLNAEQLLASLPVRRVS